MIQKIKNNLILLGSLIATIFGVVFFFLNRKNRTEEVPTKELERQKIIIDTQLKDIEKELKSIESKEYSADDIKKKFN